MMSFLVLIPAVRAAEPEVSWGCFGTGDAVGYLLVALMLALLLFLRVHRQGDVQRQQPKAAPRPSPRSLEELGRALFEAIEKGDASAYRGLFLLGLEIQKALGAEADAYIASRTPGIFEASLEKIAARVPPGATFDEVRVVGSDALALRLVDVTGARPTVIVGTVTQVDGIYRMVQPGFVDTSTARPAGAARRRSRTP